MLASCSPLIENTMTGRALPFSRASPCERTSNRSSSRLRVSPSTISGSPTSLVWASSRAQVHHVSHTGERRPVLRARVPGDDGTRGDPDADPDPRLALRLLFGAEQSDQVEHLQAGSHRARGRVVVWALRKRP